MKLSKYITSGTLITLILFTTLILLFLYTSAAFAKVGVGMGAGEIQLDEGVKPGGIYTLPSLRVFNTGDETTLYGMGIAYHQEHKELRPLKEWFSFNPATFTLEEGESQEISITMTVPVKAEPGDYFAFIESGPVPDNKPGTSVGIAVGTRLFFTVVPANIFQAITYRTSTFFTTHSPFTWIGLGIVLFIASILLFRKFFSFNIGMRNKQ